MNRSEVTGKVDVGRVLLERYRIQRFLTQGGTSALYLAEDERLGRTVCVKALRFAIGDGDIERTTREHFVQEAFALSRLVHPNTLRIYDYGCLELEGEATPFQVLEYVDGGTLAERVRESGPLRAPVALAILSQLAGALSEVHRKGIVHRDVKPNNILLFGSGDEIASKLADFGIAKSTDKAAGQAWADDTALVAGNEVRMYSVNWSAPEQFRSLDVTPATDVYAMGLVAIYMLTGKALLETDDAQQALPLRRDADALIERALAGLPAREELLPVLSAACRFECRHRLDDPRELAIRLAEALAPARDARVPLVNDITSVDTRPSVPPPPPMGLDAESSPRVVGDRAVEVVTTEPGYADLSLGNHGRVRVRFVDNGRGSDMVHLKGLNCFVARAGGRPTVAIQVDQSCSAELFSPDHRILGQLWLRFSKREDERFEFRIADHHFAVRRDRYQRAVALDTGPGGSCVFVVQPYGGRT